MRLSMLRSFRARKLTRRSGTAPFAGAGHWLVSFMRRNDGVSALEFALIAPLLAVMFVATVDGGLALYQRMTLDHVLRAGAQTAMLDPGEEQVEAILRSTAEKNFPTEEGAITQLRFDPPPVRYCACPEDADVDPASAPACSATCANSEPTFIYYRMSVQKTYESMFIPNIELGTSIQVQIR